MNLSHAEADLFFKLMWAVQFYVNRQLKILPGIESVEAYADLKMQEKVKVRQALYQHLDLINQFVAENPANLSVDELRIVHSWKRRVMDKFYILRFLKRYTVFVSAEKSAKAYAVLGLYDSLEDVLGGQPILPVFVEAVLLPFRGHIIYDGVLVPYNIMFGSGIRGDLNEIYQRAKQRGEIIESLEPGATAARPVKPRKPTRDWRPEVDSLVEATTRLKQAETVIQTRAFAVLKASALLAQAAIHDPDNLAKIYELGQRTYRTLRQLEKVLNRAA